MLLGRVALGIRARTSMCVRLKTRETDLFRVRKNITLGECMTATSWIDLVMDAAPVKAIYGPKPPTLEAIDLHEIILHRDGPRMLLRFDLHDFPEHPPKQWTAAGFNRVQMRLLVSGVRKLQITGLQSNMQVDLSINKDGPLVHLHADNGIVRFDLAAESVIVESISGYRDESKS